MSSQRFVVEGSECAFVTRLYRVILLQSPLLHPKSTTEEFSELQHPTTKVLESREQIDVPQVHKERSLEGLRMMVDRTASESKGSSLCHILTPPREPGSRTVWPGSA